MESRTKTYANRRHMTPRVLRLLNTVHNGTRFPHLTGKRFLGCALRTLSGSRKASK